MLLEMDNVHKAFGGGETPLVHAARGLSFVIRPKDFIGLVGPSGSGKTTLLNMLGGLTLPDAGQIRFQGTVLSALSERERTAWRLKHAGFIFQNFQLLPMLTALENVTLLLHAQGVRGPQKDLLARQALESVGMANMADRYPAQMSGGQQQRVAIARAIASRPSIILADEPTGNLDRQTAQTVIDIFRGFNETHGLTFLFSTHDTRLISQVHEVWELRDGKL